MNITAKALKFKMLSQLNLKCTDQLDISFFLCFERNLINYTLTEGH